MDIFVARQPIFNSQKQVVGYELLFRNGLNNVFPDIDDDVATSNVLSNAFFSFRLPELLNGKKGFINFPEKMLAHKIPLIFSQLPMVVEVLESVDPNTQILNALLEMKQKGLALALDDFVPGSSHMPLIEIADIIKFDLLATPLNELVPAVRWFKAGPERVLLAEKVETPEDYRKAMDMGFTLFQGYFFSKPEIMQKRDIQSSQILKLNLLNEVGKSEVDVDKIETLIRDDVSVTFKLLKFINSAYFNRPNSLDTLKDAITFLGTDELKKFISIIAISDLCEHKPNELVRQSVIRARMCERFSTITDTRFSPEELFLLGLFSLIEAVLDRPMGDILENMCFSGKMRGALMGEDTDFNRIMDLVVCFEKGEWAHRKLSLIRGTRFEKQMLNIYFDSVRMADHVC